MAIDISSTTRRIVYTGSAGVGPYAFNFEVLAETDLAVYFNDTELTLTTDYTVTVDADGTGDMTIVVGTNVPTTPDADDRITIVGARTIERTTDFTTGGPLFATSLNDEFDSLTIFTQQNKEEADRSIKAPVTDPSSIDMTLPKDDDRKGKYLSFNATTGNPEVVNTVTDVTTIAGIASDVTTVSGIASNVTTVANNDANVTTVATNMASVNTVATNIADVITVANDLNEAISEIETAADDLNEAVSEIDTVSNSITNVDAVGTNITNVNTVAGISANVTSVAGISANVTTVAGISGNVTTVAGISADVTTVAADGTDIGTVAGLSTEVSALGPIASDITTVAGISADVTTVAADGTDIGTVATNIANVNTVGGVISNVNTVAGISSDVTTAATNASAISTVATNISDVNTFANVYRISATAPTTSLDSGDLWWNTVDGELRAYDTNTSQWAATAPSAADQAAINVVAGDIIYTDDNGLIIDAVDSSSGSGDINTVADNIASINTLAGIDANITTVAGISADVTSVAGISSDVTTVASNVADVSSFANIYRILSADPTTSLDAGDLVFNTTDAVLKYYNGSTWTGIAPGISNVADDTTPQLGGTLDGQNNNLSNIGTIDGTNLQIDFGGL
jgi:tetrahydromethanopterin S-methyltransferase subunit B